MKKSMGKKGGAIEMMATVGAIIVFGFIIYYVVANFPTVQFIGDTQTSILSTVEFSERTFEYLDMSAHISAKNAIQTALSNGGYFALDYVSISNQYKCGKVVYPVLNDEKTIDKCWPDFKASLDQGFKSWYEDLIGKYSYQKLRSGDFSYNIEQAGNDVLVQIDGISPIEVPFYVDGDAYYNDMSAYYNVQSEGPCKNAVEYSYQYLGTGYGGTGLCPAEQAGQKGQTGKCTTQCGSFVTSVYTFSMSREIGDSLRGDGNQKCNAPGIGMKFSDPKQLQPGDIFSATSPTSTAGHTGIFVGIGRVDNPVITKNGQVSCSNEFIPDPTGEPVFIHSVNPVCFSTLNQLTSVQNRQIISFCGPTACMGTVAP